MATPQNIDQQIKTAWLVSVQLSDDLTIYTTTAPYDIFYEAYNFVSNGILASVGQIPDNVKASESAVGVSFVGVDITFKRTLLQYSDNGLGGRPVNIYRAYFDENWVLTSVHGRYFGVINSITIDDNYPDQPGSTEPVSFNVLLNLKSQQEILQNRVAGRFTVGSSMKVWYPNDTSMDQVAAIRDREFLLGRES